ncbi:MAG: S8 family serine peptidase [Bdellovibrionota bacterium]
MEIKFSLLSAYLLIIIVTVTGCARFVTPGASDKSPIVPQVSGPVIDAGKIPGNSEKIVMLSNGAEIILEKHGGNLFYTVEGTFDSQSFTSVLSSNAFKPDNERRAIVQKEINGAFEKLRGVGAIPLKSVPEVGYFKFLLPYQPMLMEAVKPVRFGHSFIFNPVTHDRRSLERIKFLSSPEQRAELGVDGRADTNAFSGLERINEREFVKQAKADIGGDEQVDGSMSNIGITDTGITFNHPTFSSAFSSAFPTQDKLKNRIKYMRDYTREGRVYFHPAAEFKASAVLLASGNESNEDLIIDAQVIITPRLPKLPSPDVFINVQNLQIKVSKELKAILLQPGSGTKLGILLEETLQSNTENVDFNNNSKFDDKIYMIYVPSQEVGGDKVFVDWSGSGDFRQAKGVHDWNMTRESMDVFAEKIGFDFRDDELPTSDGNGTIQVKSLSLVGFDPGSHGSHVAGIAAGSKTIANASNNTLARGVAPEAGILMSRVCANARGCNATEAFIDLAMDMNVDVINMSIGGLSPFNDGYGVQETMINRISSMKDVLFIISAGNDGPGRQTVGSPSTARLALSVGASASKKIVGRQYQWPSPFAGGGSSDDEDFVLFFSGRGPTAAGGFKPNLVAPGTELSSVQLNTAPGVRGGLDVYWGTSMSAPTVTGAYALLLDAIRKYNRQHPDKPLMSSAQVLKDVLISTARPFDVSMFDTQTGEKRSGQYTWVDEGTGMLDLLAAWKKMLELRDNNLPSAVMLEDESMDLDYQVLVSMVSPTGVPYNGSRRSSAKELKFGSGLYLDASGVDSLRQVHIARRLPEDMASGPFAGELTRQLLTTADEFVLKTVFYGSDKQWLRAGVLDELGCADSPQAARLLVIGRGAEIVTKNDGTAVIGQIRASTLNICLDRQMMLNELTAGEHGALIYAYRAIGDKVAVLPSFIVPVYLTVPHKVLADSTGYEVKTTLPAFGINKNFINVPKSTSIVRVEFEVPTLKKDKNGLPVAGESCSGVELNVLDGSNVSSPFDLEQPPRVRNCNELGVPKDDGASRSFIFVINDPKPGVWDMHLLGLFRFVRSDVRLRVDYVTGTTNPSNIEGDLSALAGGEVLWTLSGASLDVKPDAGMSSFAIHGLRAASMGSVFKEKRVVVESPLGLMRKYPDGTKNVTITTGDSKGNDIDLEVLECSADAADSDDASCKEVGASGGSSDVESVTFKPVKDKSYAAIVHGYDVVGEGKFTSVETINMEQEKGDIAVSGVGPAFSLRYGMSKEKIESSAILKSELFVSGKYTVTGSISIKTNDDMALGVVQISIRNK